MPKIPTLLLALLCGTLLTACGGSSSGPVGSASASGTTAEDSSIDLTPQISLPGALPGGGVALIITLPASHGTASVAGSVLRYTPNADYFGPDSFGFSASDGSTSVTGLASVTVTPVNDTPLATDQTVSTDEDTPLSVTPAISDADPGDSHTLAIVTPPTQGSVQVVAGQLRYTPTPHGNSGFTDRFTYRASDAASSSAAATISITISDVNHPPGGADVTVTTSSLVGIPIFPQVTDPDGDTAFTFTVIDGPTLGSVTPGPTAGPLTYVPTGAAGTDQFTFNVTDAGGLSLASPATATIHLTADNPPQITGPLSFTLAEDSNVAVHTSVTDPDGDSLSFSIMTPPLNGNAVGGSSLIYTPNPNFNGSDSFSFQATDGAGLSLSSPANASLTITPVNDAPLAANTAISTDEDTVGQVVPAISDPEGTPLILSIATSPTHGVATAVGNQLIYTPTPNGQPGWQDSFTYSASDGSLSSSATVTVTVTDVAHPPQVGNLISSVLQNGSRSDLAPQITDADNGDTLTLSINTAPVFGTASVNGLLVSYTPGAGFYGTDIIGINVSDGSFNTHATLTLRVVGRFATASTPQDVVFGDFNGDGNGDLALANELGDTSGEVVSLFMGDSSGGLGARIPIAPTNPSGALLGAIALTVGDLNNDGLDDLVIVYQDNDSYAVALGNTTPANMFASVATRLGNNVFPRAAVLARFNADSLLDMAIINALSDEVQVFIGQGDGTFNTQPLFQRSLGTSTSPWDIARGDLNGDGNQDLIVVTLQPNANGANLASGFLSNGSGIFVATAGESGIGIINADADVAVADLNGDGRDDVVRTLNGSDQVAVFLSTVSGGLISHSSHAVGTSPSGVAIGDVSGDGIADIIASSAADSAITILVGDGSGGFTANTPLLTHAAPTALAVGNLDTLNGLDLVTVHPANDTLGVMLH